MLLTNGVQLSIPGVSVEQMYVWVKVESTIEQSKPWYVLQKGSGQHQRASGDGMSAGCSQPVAGGVSSGLVLHSQ